MKPTEQIKQNLERANAEALKQQEAKRVADEVAKEKREHRFEILKILLTVAATLLVEHFGEIVEFFAKLFHG